MSAQEFLRQHKPQLVAMGLPDHLHLAACNKILRQIFDAGSYVQFQEGEIYLDEDENVDGEGIRASASAKYSVHAIADIEANQAVFLIDHCWTTTFPQALGHLRDIEGLSERIASMLDIREPNPAKAKTANDDKNNEEEEQQVESNEEEEEEDTVLCSEPAVVWNNIWRHMSCYTLPSDDYTRFYLMDEVGTSITHSCDPNVRCCPLLVDMRPVQQQQQQQQQQSQNTIALSLVWPIKSIAAGDMITRDFLPNVRHSDPSRPMRLLAFSRDPRAMLQQLKKPRESTAATSTTSASSTATIDENLSSVSLLGKDTSSLSPISSNIRVTTVAATGGLSTPVPEPLLLQAENTLPQLPPPQLPPQLALPAWSKPLETLENIARDKTKQPLKVFCDRPDHLNATLLHRKDRIQLVDTPEQASVLYLIDHTCGPEDDSDEEFAKRGKIINQFWWEGMVVSKEHLARTVRNAYIEDIGDDGEKSITVVPWCPVTYDCSIQSQLLGFVEDYLQGESGETEAENKKNKNIWIMKRYRGRQSMDYPVTTNLSCALRHLESAPRLACRYIHNPATYKGRKFDMRYYVLVYSLEPLVIRRHAMFVLRIANEQYTDSDFEQYQKHFTVMNYLDTDTEQQQLEVVMKDGDDDAEQRSAGGSSSSSGDDAHTQHIPPPAAADVAVDSMAAIRGKGGRENPTVQQFIEVFDREQREKKNTQYAQTHIDKHTDSDIPPAEAAARNVIDTTTNATNATGSSGDGVVGDSVWHSVAQPAIDNMIRKVFEGVRRTYKKEPPHPSGQQLHPNAGWSLNQPNVCPARAMYGVDVILTDELQPMILEVQYGPDCAMAVKFNENFWDDILSSLYLGDTTTTVEI